MRSQKPIFNGSSYDSNCDLPVKEGRAREMPYEWTLGVSDKQGWDQVGSTWFRVAFVSPTSAIWKSGIWYEPFARLCLETVETTRLSKKVVSPVSGMDKF